MSSSYTPITPESDGQFGDYYIDICKDAKRWVRASVKTYDSTGKYIFLKLFKSTDGMSYQQAQYITLNVSE